MASGLAFPWRRGRRHGGDFTPSPFGRLFLIAFGFVAFPVFLAAAPVSRFAVEVKDTPDGLPHPSVIAMTQTRDGYLWLGTPNGLVRYDGFAFRVFDENNTPGLNSSRIVYLFEDSRRVLWIGTETAGIALLKDGQVTSPPELAMGGRERRLVSACEDTEGAVWLYNAYGEIWRYHDGRFTGFVLTPKSLTDAATNSSEFSGVVAPSKRRVVVAERDGMVWFGTDTNQFAVTRVRDHAVPGLLPVADEIPAVRLDFLLASQRGGYWRFADGTISRWSSTNRLDEPIIRYPWGGNARIMTACEDRRGNLVVGTDLGGVYWIEGPGRTTRLSTESDLSNNYILSLVVDHEGTLWVGTDGGGLNRVKRKAFDTVVLPGTPDWVVQSVAEDAKGELWIASNNRSVARLQDGTPVPDRSLPESTSARSVFVNRRGDVFLGTLALGRTLGLWRWQSGGFLLERDTFPTQPQVKVNVLHETASGRLLVGTDNGLMQRDGNRWSFLTSTNGLSADAITAVAEDSQKGLWVGTQGGGLNLVHDGNITVHRRREGELPSDDITALLIDDEGTLWVGTAGGLAWLHGNRWSRITRREGLASDSIAFLLDDGRESLWIGSNQGLMRVPKKDLKAFADGRIAAVAPRVYGRADGMPTANCSAGSQPSAARTRDGRLWFPTSKGLVSVRPEDLSINTNPPPVIIESVLVDGEPWQAGNLAGKDAPELILPSRRERLEIHYTSLNLGAPERARFRYRLDRHETDWIEAGKVRVAYYFSKLPPGDYRFVVTACNEDGVWNEEGAALSLVVLPPYWATWWFRTASAVVVLGLVVATVFYVSTQKLHRQLTLMKQQEMLEKERARIARDIHDQLGASLTQLALLGELVETDKDSPVEIEGHAQQICQTARETTRTLDEIVWTVNPSNDTLEGVVNYVCKYAQEYLAVAGLRYRLEIPPQVPEASVAPEVRHNIFLAAKEAITNVVRHAHATSAWLRLHLEPHRFTLEISDDGRGLAGMDRERAATRNGLTNMRRRMEEVGGAFEFNQRPEGGTTVRLTAPLQTDREKKG